MNKHFMVSTVKSIIRIIAGASLMCATLNPWIFIAGLGLIIAEVLGIVEEIVDDR